MKITVKLFAQLGDYLPVQERQGNEVKLEVANGALVHSVINSFGLPEKWVHLVLVNGVYIAPEHRLAHVLAEGDALAIWPPIAGG